MKEPMVDIVSVNPFTFPGCFFPTCFADLLRLSLLLENDIPRLIFPFCFLRGSIGEVLEVSKIFWGSSEEKVLTSEDVSQMSTVLIVIGGVEIDDISEGTGV